MDQDQTIREISVSLQKSNARAMTPVTLTFIFGMLVYVAIVLQGVLPPEPMDLSSAWIGDLSWNLGMFMVKVVGVFLVLGMGVNTVIFEIWSRRQLRRLSKVLAWDGDPQSMPHEEVLDSIIALIDFPQRFAKRFIGQWLIAAPVIVVCLQFFYTFPWLTILKMTAGVTAILCLMCTLHYFVIKGFFSRQLGIALRKYPSYFRRPELAKVRVHYQSKILLYILVLVGGITWITTHLSLAAQQRSTAYQLDETLAQRIAKVGPNLESSLERNEGSILLKVGVDAILGDAKYAFLLDAEQENLYLRELPGGGGFTKEVPDFARRIMDAIPMLSRTPRNLPWTTKFLSNLRPFRSLVVRITDRVMIAFSGRQLYTVTVDKIGQKGQWHLVSIQPQSLSLVQWSTQMGPVIAMFIVALTLSLIFARFMQRELLNPLSRIIDSSKRVESGDLSDLKPVMADDELGVLAIHHLRMIESIKSMVRQINSASKSIESGAGVIAARTEEMELGSQAQSVAVEETSATITQMNQSIAAIAESVDTLASSAEQSSASIIQMSATNDQVAASSESLSAGIEETTASIQEMSASIKQVAENVRGAADKTSSVAGSMREMREAVKQIDQIAARTAAVSEEVTRDSATGGRAVQTTIQGIERIRQISLEAAEVIERLYKRAREIGRILTVIEDVTEETNLLALNAAIIAAQAGEHGRSFAVVADEIKDLAERTQASTTEIADQIKAVQKEARDAVSTVKRSEETVEDGVRLSDEAGRALSKIQESATKSLEMARKISESTMEQSRQVDQVLSYFEDIAGMIEQIHTATQEQNKGSEQIILAAERMKDVAGQVKKATREQAIGGRQISKSIEHITSIANYINNSQGEQRKAAQQVLSAISRIAEIAHQNVEGVEKVTASVADLKVLADDFRIMLDTFRLENENQDEDGEG